MFCCQEPINHIRLKHLVTRATCVYKASIARACHGVTTDALQTGHLNVTLLLLQYDDNKVGDGLLPRLAWACTPENRATDVCETRPTMLNNTPKHVRLRKTCNNFLLFLGIYV